MYCKANNNYYSKYNPNTVNNDYSIQITPGIINTLLTPYYTEFEKESNKIYFSYVMLYVIFPLLYIIFTTGSLNSIMTLYGFVQSGIFDAIQGIKQFLLNTVICTLRVFGFYTFSTYTVVKNGRSIFSSTSEYFFIKSTRFNIKRTDQAKHSVCKWIDNECEIYRRVNNGEEPELTESHNDIYDLIIHTFRDDIRARVHRGDFRISTHTSLTKNYRKFCKSYQICETVELRVPIADVNASNQNGQAQGQGQEQLNDTKDASTTAATEVIFINLKHPTHFYVEKNILLDKKFLRWYLYSKLGRKDLADYIGLPYSKYEVNIYYEDCMKECGITVKPEPRVLEAIAQASENITSPIEVRNRVFTVNDSQHVLIGDRYILKVDSILGCPVFESIDKEVFHIDDALTNYYENSVCSNTDNDDDNDNDDDESAVSESLNESDSDSDSDSESETKTDTVPATDTKPTADIQDNEFEIIETSTD